MKKILYHGTDARIIRMSETERASFKEDCLLAIDYMWPFFDHLYNDWEEVPVDRPGYEGCMTVRQKIETIQPLLEDKDNPYLYDNLHDTLTRWNAGLLGNRSYEYGAFYVTAVSFVAKDYARRSFAFGEIGLTAFRMYEAVLKLCFPDWNPDDRIKSAIDRIYTFGKSTPEPVIFEIEVNSASELLSEDGKDASSDKWLDGHYRLKHPIVLDLENAIPYNDFVIQEDY